jgi:SAM-dependent methyltransferase
LSNVYFAAGDAQIYPFPEGGFDVAISRFGLMFFDDPKVGFSNLAEALVTGGRLAFRLRGMSAGWRQVADAARLRGSTKWAGTGKERREPAIYGRSPDDQHLTRFRCGFVGRTIWHL